VRTFDRRAGVIEGYFDNLLCEAPPQPVFGRPKTAASEIPSQPRTSVARRSEHREASAGRATGNAEPDSSGQDPAELADGAARR